MMAVWQWLFGLWSLAFAASAGDASVGEIGPNTLSSSCESCHAQEVRDWRRSRHAVAFTNGLFRLEFDGRRTAWCASCHAPAAADPQHVRDDDPVAIEGVGCVACHLDGAGRLVSRTRSPQSPHQTLADPSFGSDSSCSACHEFNFPVMGADGMPVGFQDLPMQETVSQFRATAFAAKGGQCIDCHMRAEAGPHAFAGSHDPRMLQSALDFDVCRQGKTVRVALGNVGAAHSVPTGGVNRHIVLRSWRSSQPAALQEFFIGRRFAGSDAGKELLEDSTLPAGSSRRFIFLPDKLGGTKAEAINVELRYVYPLDEFAELAPGTSRYAIIFQERTPLANMPDCEP